MSTKPLDSPETVDRSRTIPKLSRKGLNFLWLLPVVLAVVAIVYLSIRVLVPTAKDPGSNLYSTWLGYPAHQRRAGEPIKVTTTKVVDEAFPDFVAAAGETVGLVDVEMRPQVTGIVKQLLVAEGQRVKKGDPLVRLDSAPMQDQLNRAKAELAIAELQHQFGPGIDAAKKVELEAGLVRSKELLRISEERLKRYSTLKDQKAASSEEYATAQELHANRVYERASAEQQLREHVLNMEQNSKQSDQTLTIKKAAVNQAGRDLANTNIVAPCDGLVTHVATQVGELAAQDTVVMNLANDVVFEAYIDQTGIDAVSPGDVATVRLVAFPGKQFRGKVVRVNPSVDTQGRVGERGRTDTRFTYSAWVKLEGDDLPPGLQGHAEFSKDTTKAAIPDSAVMHLSAGEGMVMVVRDGRALVLQVELGRARGELREIKSGLEPTDQVVLDPRGLEAGDLLQVANTETDQRISRDRPRLRNRSGT
ncbi:MAG TPA: efflux RND transporter periplasmic adaptor subunit [Lacipirellulaceae bacterium]|nr:efflux RND transporter periplasmic adaptor subunit [Lacipirellulaceae bacterium]